MSNFPTPQIWDGDHRVTGTEDFHNDNDPSQYTGPAVPAYQETFQVDSNGIGFNAYSIVLQPGVPVRILGQDASRNFFYLNAVAPNTVLIGEQGVVAAGLGYIVNGGERFRSTDEIWAVPVGAGAITVSYWVEHSA